MKKLLAIAVIIIVAVVAWGATRPSTPTTSTQGTTPTEAPASGPAALGEHCGGNMTTARACSVGLRCAPTPGSHLPFGDVGGVCVKG